MLFARRARYYFAVIVIFFLMTFILLSQRKAVDLEKLESQYVDVRDRLLFAIAQNRQHEINANFGTRVLNEKRLNGSLFPSQLINNLVPKVHNMSLDAGISLNMTVLYVHLPHLINRPQGLVPVISLSRGRRGVSVVIGIPTVKRDSTSYLTLTLTSLTAAMSEKEKNDCLIVVFIAEPFNKHYALEVIDLLKKSFTSYIDSGLLEVVVPSADFYPNLSNLTLSYGDTAERVRWRTKQVIDFVYLMVYSWNKGLYYVQLEDDVMSKPGFLSIMTDFAHQQKSDWFLLEFSKDGFIGKMFKSTDLPFLVEFLLMFHHWKPVDWLLDYLLRTKVCNPEMNYAHCVNMMKQVRITFSPSLFQHIGTQSSLSGKFYKLKGDKTVNSGLLRAHLNPTAVCSTTLNVYKTHTIGKAYVGESVFWALPPHAGDTIDFKFSEAVLVEWFFFRSGNVDHPGDIVLNSSVEVWPVAGSPVNGRQDGVAPSTGFVIVGSFNASGMAEGTLRPAVGKVTTMRIHFSTQHGSNWVLLSEIFISWKHKMK